MTKYLMFFIQEKPNAAASDRDFTNYNQSGNYGQPDYTFDQSLRTNCLSSGGDQNLFYLDFVNPIKFDNSYFKNLQRSVEL